MYIETICTREKIGNTNSYIILCPSRKFRTEWFVIGPARVGKSHTLVHNGAEKGPRPHTLCAAIDNIGRAT